MPLMVLVMLALIVHYQFGSMLGAALWLLVLAMLYFFRDPIRKIPPSPLAIVAPVDGKIVSIEDVIDPYLNRRAKRIQLSCYLTGPYTVRSVTEGKIQKQWFGNLPPDSEEGIYAATGVPAYAQWVQTDEADDVITTMAPKFFVSSVGCNVGSGERIGQGKPCTFVPFGADAEVLLAENSKIEVKSGDRVEAGSSIIATLVH